MNGPGAAATSNSTAQSQKATMQASMVSLPFKGPPPIPFKGPGPKQFGVVIKPPPKQFNVIKPPVKELTQKMMPPQKLTQDKAVTQNHQACYPMQLPAQGPPPSPPRKQRRKDVQHPWSRVEIKQEVGAASSSSAAAPVTPKRYPQVSGRGGIGSKERHRTKRANDTAVQSKRKAWDVHRAKLNSLYGVRHDG